MPKLIIDEREIEVPAGTKVIDAAERAGIYIPRFCFHPALGAVGACRVCAVRFLEGPITGVEMSCMIDARDGMKVSTTDPEAVDFRRYVIEWLMVNHPHDCPVCDEGGRCLLQDLTVAGGHGMRRYGGEKRTYPDQYLGPLIQHEMNRCIQCYRCVRFYREFAGGDDFGVTGIAGRIYYGRFAPGVLESPFSGNLVDICPTGVFTDKPSRFSGRRWDMQRTTGVCIHCGLGCKADISTRYRSVVRLEAAYDAHTNGFFLCDRGRYGYFYANRPDRPRMGGIDGGPAPPMSALETAASRLDTIRSAHGGGAVALLASGRGDLLTAAALFQLSARKGFRKPVFGPRRPASTVLAAVSRLTPETAVSLREIESADVVFMAGADPVNEAPMLALALRQAVRKGAVVAAADPRPLELPFGLTHLCVGFDGVSAVLETLIEAAGAPPAGETTETAGGGGEETVSGTKTTRGGAAPQNHLPESFISRLIQAKRPVIVCGTEILDPPAVEQAARLAETLRRRQITTGLFFVLPEANSYGTALLAASGFPPITERMETHVAETLVSEIEAGTIKALVAVESDLDEMFPDRARWNRAVDRLELVVAADCISTGLYDRADIQIPVQTVFEGGGLFVNQEGRARWSPPVHTGGTPIAVTGRGSHPPRRLEPAPPGPKLPAGREVPRRLAGDPLPEEEDSPAAWMAEVPPVLAPLAKATRKQIIDSGVRLFLQPEEGPPPAPAAPEAKTGAGKQAGFRILTPAALFGTEPLSRRSECLQDRRESILWMSETDASDLGAATGDVLGLTFGEHTVELPVRVTKNTAPGVLVTPRFATPELRRHQEADPWFIRRDAVRVLKRGES